MMEEKRLSELLKQRALIEEHLIWLDAEIDAAQSESSVPVASGVPANRLKEIEDSIGEKVDVIPIPKPNPNLAAADIYEELGPDTRDSAKDARRGCMGIFAFAFLALGAIAAWVWFKY